MKKIILSLAFAAICISALAIPARPVWRHFAQPDGSTIELKLVGDEFGHTFVDRSGQAYRKGSDGFYRPVSAAAKAGLHRTAASKRARANARRVRAKAAGAVSGSPKIPVLLVEFSDKKFKSESKLSPTYSDDPQVAFTNLLTRNGYSYNGATGSVLDFYIDNSNGAYTPEFVVLPVVTLTKSMSAYGGNDSSDNDVAPELAVYEAVKYLDGKGQDFSRFDNDGDGLIDMILMYYAGMNEAEGAEENTIWPHQWSVQESSLKDGDAYISSKYFDGKKLDKYFCTSELTVSSWDDYTGDIQKAALCGIGTTCHEFAHSLGLPDFYDTDYATNGSAGATYYYDTMCSGSYNNSGNTPPFFSAEELLMLGWMDQPTDLPVMGSVTIPALSKTTKVAYKGASSTDGEYFVFECRGTDSWDKYIEEGPGLIVYHVDKSKNRSISFKYEDQYGSQRTARQTPYQLWDEWETYNSINVLATHPCYYIIPAGCQNYNADTSEDSDYGHPSATTGLNYSGTDFAFGTSSKYSSYTPVDWEKKTMDYSLRNISYSSGKVTFTTGIDICRIVVPDSYSAGASFPLKLDGAPSGSSVKWFYDDTPASGASLTLTAGHHLIEARVTSGKKTIHLELEIDVE